MISFLIEFKPEVGLKVKTQFNCKDSHSKSATFSSYDWTK